MTQSETRKNPTRPTGRYSPLQRLLTICALFSVLTLIWEVVTAYRLQGCFLNSVQDYIAGSAFFNLLTILLAVISIAFAFDHERQLRKQTRHLDDQVEQLKWLEGSLSTRRTATFPKYLADIGALAVTAKTAGPSASGGSESPKYLDILVDCLDYGSFFEPGVHRDVHSSILLAARPNHMTIRLLVCVKGAPVPITAASGTGLKEYKPKDRKDLFLKYFSALRADPGFTPWVKRKISNDKDGFKGFAKSWFNKEPTNLKSGLEEWIDCKTTVYVDRMMKEMKETSDSPVLTQLLQFRQWFFAEQLQLAGVDIRGCLQDESLFFWLKYNDRNDRSNKDEALFTFANAARGRRQLGFATHDPDLLTNFFEMFDAKWKDAEHKEPPWLKVLAGMGKIDTPQHQLKKLNERAALGSGVMQAGRIAGVSREASQQQPRSLQPVSRDIRMSLLNTIPARR